MGNMQSDRLVLLEKGEAAGKLRPEHQRELDQYRAAAASPRQATGPTPEEMDRVYKRASGVLVSAVQDDPLAGIHDPKRRDITRGALTAAGAKELAKSQVNVDTARSTLSELEEFDQLNNEIKPQGGWRDNAAQWVASALGSSKHSRMDQLTNSMARHMRQAGEGAVSDYEGKLFKSMVGGYDKPFAANVSFSKAARALAERNIAQHQFRESFLQANGSLIGADTLWSRYRDANPIMDRKGNVLKAKTPQEFYANRAQTWLDGEYTERGGTPRNARAKPPSAPPSTRKPAAKAGWTVKKAP